MEVTREIVVEEDRDEVWDALIDSERLSDWFANDVELEAVEGGSGVFRWDDGETRRALVEEIVPERRLAFRWGSDDGDESRVAIELETVEQGTRVTVTESTLGPRAAAGEWSVALALRALAVAARA